MISIIYNNQTKQRGIIFNIFNIIRFSVILQLKNGGHLSIGFRIWKLEIAPVLSFWD